MYFENVKKTSSMHLRKCALNKVLKIKLKMVVEGGTKKVLKVKLQKIGGGAKFFVWWKPDRK